MIAVAGLAEGEVQLRVAGWQEGLAAVEAAGIVPPISGHAALCAGKSGSNRMRRAF